MSEQRLAGGDSVTVIMPVRNEAEFIARTLATVLDQDYPSDRLEILVVDGMSDDGTRELVLDLVEQQRAPGRESAPITLLDNPSRIVPAAMNIGIERARGIVVRVDGHCELAPDYVTRCVAALRESGADNVGGVQRAVGEGAVGGAIALAVNSRFGVGTGKFHYARTAGWVDTVYLGAYPTDVFARIGGYDEELVRNQDDELNLRLIEAGGKVWLDPSIRSTYHSRNSLISLWRQYFGYGFYKVRVLQKHRVIASWRQLVPIALVLGLLVSGVLAALAGQLGWSFVVAGPYVAVVALASLWTGRRQRRLIPGLAAAFVTLHLAYGVGYLSGLLRWFARVLRVRRG